MIPRAAAAVARTTGALACGLMMASLGAATWWRLLVWTLIGVAVYLLYGYRHSRLHAAG